MIQYIIAAGIGAFLGSQSKKSKKSYAHGGKTDEYVAITLKPKKSAYRGGKGEIYKSMQLFYDTINSTDNKDKYGFIHSLFISDSRKSDPKDISEIKVYMIGEKSGFDDVEKRGLYDFFDLVKTKEEVKDYAKGGKTDDWLFVGSYPTGTTYSDRTKSQYGDYKQIAYVYDDMQSDFEGGKLIKYRLKIYSDNKKYQPLIKDLEKQFGKGVESFAKGGIITGAGKSGLDKIKKTSKDNPSQMYKVTDDNYSNIGNFYLKNGKFAKKTVSNADYDFAKNKVSLRPKSDVIYKATEIEGKGGYFDKGGEVGKYPFYVHLERFGLVGAFNSEKDAKAYIKHEVDLIYEGMPNERKKERAEARKEYSIISREEAEKYTGYIVRNIDEKVGSSYKDYYGDSYAKGGYLYKESDDPDANETFKDKKEVMEFIKDFNESVETNYKSISDFNKGEEYRKITKF